MKAFLDSSTIIFGLEKPHSNSAKILDSLVAGEFEGVINEKVILEVRKYIRNRKGKQMGYLVESMLRKNATVVNEYLFYEYFEALKKEIKLKDVEHLATARGMGIEIIVAYDRDFEGLTEYMTPGEFVGLLGKKQSETPF